MDDRFLNELQQAPDPAFESELGARLRRQAPAPLRAAFPWRPAVAVAAVAAVVVSLFAFPSLRVSAQSMLDMFRVRNFAAVKFDPSRLQKLHGQGQNDGLLMLGKTETLQEPGKPLTVSTPDAAGAIAGIDVETPSELPRNLVLQHITVDGAAAGRLTADATKLRALLEALDIRDLDVPQSIDGKTITVRKPAVVVQSFGSDHRHAVLIQAKSPDVELPAGVDLNRLAEIGMRILGVERGQAHQLAQTVDWHTTLLVPVPPNASSFRSIEVNGNHGLLITTQGDFAWEHERTSGPNASGGSSSPTPTQAAGPPRDGALVLWSGNDRVYALMGDLEGVELVQMAESVR